MKFLLDEMYTPAIARECRKRGLDVVSVQERRELSGAPDEAVLCAASDDRRVLISNNHLDFMVLIDQFAAQGRDHFGVLLTSDRSLPRTSEGIGRLVRSIAAFADAPDDDLLNAVTWLPAV